MLVEFNMNASALASTTKSKQAKIAASEAFDVVALFVAIPAFSGRRDIQNGQKLNQSLNQPSGRFSRWRGDGERKPVYMRLSFKSGAVCAWYRNVSPRSYYTGGGVQRRRRVRACAPLCCNAYRLRRYVFAVLRHADHLLVVVVYPVA